MKEIWGKFDRGGSITDEEIQVMLDDLGSAMKYLESRHCDESRILLRKATEDRRRLLDYVYWRKFK